MINKTYAECVGNNGTLDSLYCGSDYLQRGCKGASVTNLQTNLNKLISCNLETDGSFGKLTEDCVKQFQSSKGITVDGIAGPTTLKLISEALLDNSSPSKTPSSTLKWYKITFDSNGGYFANEMEKIVMYVYDSMSFKVPTIPGKYENQTYYKFKGWYDSNNSLVDLKNLDLTKYGTSTSKINEFTLTAKWEQSNVKKFCRQGDVFDIESGSCIYTQVYDANKYPNVDSEKAFVPNNRTLETQRKADLTCSNNILIRSDFKNPITGANNQVACDDGYDKDWWYSNVSCLVGNTCDSNYTATECISNISGMCHATYPAESIVSVEDPVDDGNGGNKGTNGDKGTVEGSKSSSKTNDSISYSPKTGNTLFFIAIVIGFGALGYAIYYFTKLKKNDINNEKNIEVDEMVVEPKKTKVKKEKNSDK